MCLIFLESCSGWREPKHDVVWKIVKIDIHFSLKFDKAWHTFLHDFHWMPVTIIFKITSNREQKEREKQQKLEQEKEEKRRRQQEEEKKRREEEEKRRKAEKEKADKEKAAKKVQ